MFISTGWCLTSCLFPNGLESTYSALVSYKHHQDITFQNTKRKHLLNKSGFSYCFLQFYCMQFKHSSKYPAQHCHGPVFHNLFIFQYQFLFTSDSCCIFPICWIFKTLLVYHWSSWALASLSLMMLMDWLFWKNFWFPFMFSSLISSSHSLFSHNFPQLEDISHWEAPATIVLILSTFNYQLLR